MGVRLGLAALPKAGGRPLFPPPTPPLASPRLPAPASSFVSVYVWVDRRPPPLTFATLPPALPSLLQRFRQTSSWLAPAVRVRLRIYLGGKDRRTDRVHRCERLVAELIHHGQRLCLRSSSKRFFPLSLCREQSDEPTLRLKREKNKTDPISGEYNQKVRSIQKKR